MFGLWAVLATLFRHVPFDPGMFPWNEVRHSLHRSLQLLGAQSFALPVACHQEDSQTLREAAEPLLYKAAELKPRFFDDSRIPHMFRDCGCFVVTRV